MPVKLGAKLQSDNAEARIEIVPLIDIMFFLLASFMLVSLSMVNLKSVKVELPSSTAGAGDTKKDSVDVSVNEAGVVFLDKKPVNEGELTRSLVSGLRANPHLRVIISGDRQARHGDIIRVLDGVRAAGIDHVSFEIRQNEKPVNP